MVPKGGNEEFTEIARLYDYVPSYRNRADIAFFVEAATTIGSPVLEVGCGTGRVLIPTARAGAEIVGVDLSPQALAVCHENVRGESAAVQSRVQLIQADIRRFSTPLRFRLATLPFRVYNNMLTIDDQLSCLAVIRDHLVDSGLLILDTYNPSVDFLANVRVEQECVDQPEFMMPDGRRVVRRQKTVACDRFRQIHEYEIIYYVIYPDGRTERLVHSVSWRYTFRFEAEHMLARSGFAVEHVYADYAKKPYGSKYPGELVFEARKR